VPNFEACSETKESYYCVLWQPVLTFSDTGSGISCFDPVKGNITGQVTSTISTVDIVYTCSNGVDGSAPVVLVRKRVQHVEAALTATDAPASAQAKQAMIKVG
jgi:hypothetical protein